MRVRRHLPPLRQRRKFRLPSVKIRGAWPWLAGAAVLGYLVTVVWLFPEPILASDNPVPRVMDLPSADAIDRLSEAGFRGRVVETEPHPDAPSGTVTWQDPPPALEAPAGAVVRLTVSNGPPEIPIPDVVGLQTLLAGEKLPAGFHERVWQGVDDRGQAVASGVYLYRLRAGSRIRVERMTLIR